MNTVTHEEFTKNGVKVKITNFRDINGASSGRTIEADCLCYGIPFRVHTNPVCPNVMQSSSKKK